MRVQFIELIAMPHDCKDDNTGTGATGFMRSIGISHCPPCNARSGLKNQSLMDQSKLKGICSDGLGSAVVCSLTCGGRGGAAGWASIHTSFSFKLFERERWSMNTHLQQLNSE